MRPSLTDSFDCLSKNARIVLSYSWYKSESIATLQSLPESQHVLIKQSWIKGRIRSGGFLRIFKVAFLLCLAPAGQIPNTAGQSLTLT